MDHEAAEHYEKYRDELIRFASALVGPSGAEDVMTNAVVRAFSSRHWTTVNERRAYLYQAVANEARHQHRSTQRRLRREVSAGPQVGSPDTPVVRTEVLAAMHELTVRQRAVVFLTYWQDLSASEVADGLDLSIRTVERELTTARRRLEALLR